ncbi:unnamed protein product [Pedinophyceae sp. YPF-701]|nr:unnamed protein product [Pedinophyceae sp. YPF-701]
MGRGPDPKLPRVMLPWAKNQVSKPDELAVPKQKDGEKGLHIPSDGRHFEVARALLCAHAVASKEGKLVHDDAPKRALLVAFNCGSTEELKQRYTPQSVDEVVEQLESYAKKRLVGLRSSPNGAAMTAVREEVTTWIEIEYGQETPEFYARYKRDDKPFFERQADAFLRGVFSDDENAVPADDTARLWQIGRDMRGTPFSACKPLGELLAEECATLSDFWTRLEGIVDVEATYRDAPSDTDEVVFPDVFCVPYGSVVWYYTHLYRRFGHAKAPRLDEDLVAKAKRKLQATGAEMDTVDFLLRVVQYEGVVDIRDPLPPLKRSNG